MSRHVAEAILFTGAIKELDRTDTSYSVGVVDDQGAGGHNVYFDLPRVSPLQLNVTTDGVSGQQQLIDKIKAAIIERFGIKLLTSSNDGKPSAKWRDVSDSSPLRSSPR